MIHQRDSIAFQGISRQLAVKSENSASFPIRIRNTLQKYNLPDAYYLINTTPSKGVCKSMVREATNTTYRNNLMEEQKSKTSLRYLTLQQHPMDEPHPIYKYTGSDPHEIEKAAIKARILTGTYTLQANRHKFNQYEVDKTCELCAQEAEDREHFILRCSALQEARQKHLSKLLELVPNPKEDSTDLIQCILDCSHEDLAIPPKELEKIEKINRSLLYELHIQRTRKLPAKK